MFHIRDEGEKVRPGFNFYPWHSNLFGFWFVGPKGKDYYVWFSKKRRHICFGSFRNY